MLEILLTGGLVLVTSVVTQALANKAQSDREKRERQASLDKQHEAHADASFAAAQQASIERRLDAGEKLYASLLEFQEGLPTAIGILDVLLVSEYETVRDNTYSDAAFGYLNEQDFHQFIETFGGGKLGNVSLYIDDDVHDLYMAYTTMMMRVWILLIWSQTKETKHIYWHEDKIVNQHLSSVLTSDAERLTFDSMPCGKLRELYRLVEWKIREGLRQTVTGHRDGSESRKRTYADAPLPYRNGEE